jgi:environmental stress-induced protein Ves
MTVHLIHADDVSPQAWKNGGGQTRELLAWPSADDWSLRISLADIDADGPFSAFAGVERWFAVVEGAGVELQFAQRACRVTPGDPPLHFDGAAAVHCRLIEGRTRDLNLMCRGGRGGMRAAEDGVQWGTPAKQCGLFAAVAGVWACADHRRIAVPARTLLWFDQAPRLPHAFKAAQTTDRTVGWWLHFSPAAGPA